jgi:hypothetical protein
VIDTSLAIGISGLCLFVGFVFGAIIMALMAAAARKPPVPPVRGVQ